jgi:hypothetical protein
MSARISRTFHYRVYRAEHCFDLSRNRERSFVVTTHLSYSPKLISLIMCYLDLALLFVYKTMSSTLRR